MTDAETATPAQLIAAIEQRGDRDAAYIAIVRRASDIFTPETAADLADLVLSGVNAVRLAIDILNGEKTDTASALLKWLIEVRFGETREHRRSRARRKPALAARKQRATERRSGPDETPQA